MSVKRDTGRCAARESTVLIVTLKNGHTVLMQAQQPMAPGNDGGMLGL
jgi:hypothetical protein